MGHTVLFLATQKGRLWYCSARPGGIKRFLRSLHSTMERGFPAGRMERKGRKGTVIMFRAGCGLAFGKMESKGRRPSVATHPSVADVRVVLASAHRGRRDLDVYLSHSGTHAIIQTLSASPSLPSTPLPPPHRPALLVSAAASQSLAIVRSLSPSLVSLTLCPSVYLFPPTPLVPRAKLSVRPRYNTLARTHRGHIYFPCATHLP